MKKPQLCVSLSALMLILEEFEVLQITTLLTVCKCHNTDTKVVNGLFTQLILTWIVLFH